MGDLDEIRSDQIRSDLRGKKRKGLGLEARE